MELSQSGLRHTGNTAREEMKMTSLAGKAMPGMRALKGYEGDKEWRKVPRQETEIRGGGAGGGRRS